MNLDKYLEELEKAIESVFAMDSIHTGKPLEKSVYSQNEEEDLDEDE